MSFAFQPLAPAAAILDDVAASTGDANITQAPDSLSAGGSVGVTGAASITQSANTLGAAGSVGITGAANQNQAAHALSASGSVGVTGDASITQGADTLSTAGGAIATGDADIAQEPNSLVASGTVADPSAGIPFPHRIIGVLTVRPGPRARFTIGGTVLLQSTPFYRGESYVLTAPVTIDDVAVDLASGEYELATCEYVLKASLNDSDPVLVSKTLNSGITVDGSSIALLLTTADTKSIPAGEYWEMVIATFAASPTESRYIVKPQRRPVRSVVKLPV